MVTFGAVISPDALCVVEKQSLSTLWWRVSTGINVYYCHHHHHHHHCWTSLRCYSRRTVPGV